MGNKSLNLARTSSCIFNKINDSFGRQISQKVDNIISGLEYIAKTDSDNEQMKSMIKERIKQNIEIAAMIKTQLDEICQR